jgi:hypothetical protein
MSERKFAIQRAANEWKAEIETDEDLDLLWGYSYQTQRILLCWVQQSPFSW